MIMSGLEMQLSMSGGNKNGKCNVKVTLLLPMFFHVCDYKRKQLHYFLLEQ
jgi:hypothetical protein